MTDPNQIAASERHDWRCDCEWCWLGVTLTPKPPSLWQKIMAAVRTIIERDSNGNV